ncbi:hypothetical protein ORI89_04525 [Sphingobacterium sp. UT-1RO-CII-1]|uniref:cytidine deaminase family protein n=1 Tax=Sphingobacterium sp. UT-1RO-CII-1 TaxID=2995225 RepID=UPI00227A62B6|nr:cytidine deaminase [Sphingobacterium sp. UT-1RO-CII-1]MCY4778903.1 hypothetical protein [Sphingobacterium sp. UT-1RO-CII-1]
MDFRELKQQALTYAKHRELNKFISFGSVAAAILTSKGNVYVGVSIDTACSMGFCAEHAAIAEMLKNQEVKIEKLIAVTESGDIVPPCGRCREFITQLSQDNHNALVMVDSHTTLTILDLLPYDWKAKVSNTW